jgi:hypothetical protein
MPNIATWLAMEKGTRIRLGGGVTSRQLADRRGHTTHVYPVTGIQKLLIIHTEIRHIPAAARSNTWICGLSLAGIVASNLSRGVDVSLL